MKFGFAKRNTERTQFERCLWKKLVYFHMIASLAGMRKRNQTGPDEAKPVMDWDWIDSANVPPPGLTIAGTLGDNGHLLLQFIENIGTEKRIPL
ncbi:MAG: hypothetical protein ABSH45_13130 [Bryobacteraceae bacterium]